MENLTSGSIGGGWSNSLYGEVDHTHLSGKPARLSPPEPTNDCQTSRLPYLRAIDPDVVYAMPTA